MSNPVWRNSELKCLRETYYTIEHEVNTRLTARVQTNADLSVTATTTAELRPQLYEVSCLAPA
jgi:DNA-directed RNA polymerase subunit L